MTGQALSRILAVTTERALAKLLAASDIGEVRALQAEIALCQKLLDVQKKPPMNLNPQ